MIKQKLKKVLLVDDDEINNFLNLRLLTKLQISEEIIVKTNGKNAYDYFASIDSTAYPEIIILDHFMPVMDGVEFMIKLKKLVRLEEIKAVILLLGAGSSKEDVDLFLELGVHEVACKPLSEKMVKVIYEKFLGKNKLIINVQYQ